MTITSIFLREYHTFVCPIIGAMIVESSSSSVKNPLQSLSKILYILRILVRRNCPDVGSKLLHIHSFLLSVSIVLLLLILPLWLFPFSFEVSFVKLCIGWFQLSRLWALARPMTFPSTIITRGISFT